MENKTKENKYYMENKTTEKKLYMENRTMEKQLKYGKLISRENKMKQNTTEKKHM